MSFDSSNDENKSAAPVQPGVRPAVKFGEFKGNPTIGIPLSQDGERTFSFGYTKAKAVLDYIDDIKKFVDDNPPRFRKK